MYLNLRLCSRVLRRGFLIQCAILVQHRVSLYSGGEVWKGIWNQTHLVVLNFCLERSHHVTTSNDKARSNRWRQWPELFRTYRAVNFCKQSTSVDNGAMNLSESTWVQEFKFSQPMQIFDMINELNQGRLMHIFIRLMQFLNPGQAD